MRSRPNSISVDTNSQPTFAVDELIKAVESKFRLLQISLFSKVLSIFFEF